MNKILKRELEVAFSRHSQPVWFRILKYILLALLLYFFWGSDLLLIILLILFVLAMCLHLWYRHKTNAWTKSYGLWKYHKTKNDTKEK